MILSPLVFIVALLFSQATCSFYHDPVKRLDMLMAHHRFIEARRLLDSSLDMPRMVCTVQVISRCIDLRNYKPVDPWKLISEHQPPSRSFLRALAEGTVATDPEEIKSEANAILDIILPHALQNKVISTSALNTAVFHCDFDLMKRLISFGWDKFGGDVEGLSPLMKAFKHHRRTVFQWLLDHGADFHFVNDLGDNLAHVWARNIHSDFVISYTIHDLIIDHGLDWTKENLSGMTPLKIAKIKMNHFFLEQMTNEYATI